MYKYVIIGIVVLIIFFILTETFFKGFIGETMISINLKKLIKKQGFVINNLIIEENDKSNQMDHILISKKGIFCVETKNYSGTIYGDDKRKEWTQVFNFGKQKYNFYSPVFQNKNHIRSLNNIIKDYNINNVVIFYNNNIDNIDSKYVYTVKSFKKYYLSLNDIITEEDVNKIYSILKNIKDNQISNKKHLENIKKNQK